MKRHFVSVAGLFLLGACSNTGIVPIDGNAYMVAVRSPKVGFSTADDEKAEAYQAASAYCAKEGKKVETVKLTMVNAGLARSASASLEFRCV